MSSPESLRTVVLLVEDEPLLRQSASRLLQRLGAEVVTASGGREAFALLGAMAAPPDLVLTDLQMPEGDGEELLGAIRGDPALASIPVVAVSGIRTSAPFDHFVPKPFGAAELREALHIAAPATLRACA